MLGVAGWRTLLPNAEEGASGVASDSNAPPQPSPCFPYGNAPDGPPPHPASARPARPHRCAVARIRSRQSGDPLRRRGGLVALLAALLLVFLSPSLGKAQTVAVSNLGQANSSAFNLDEKSYAQSFRTVSHSRVRPINESRHFYTMT